MELKRLEEFVTLRQGLAINNSSAHLVSEKKDNIFIYPLLRIADMMEKKYDKYISKNVNPNVIAKEDDIIYTRTGQIGLAFKGYKGVLHNNSFIVSIVNDKLDKDYLFVVLNSDFVRKQAINLAKNSVQPDLTHNMFKSIIIPVPSKKEQKNIAYYYKIVTKKIENNNKVNKEIEQLSKTIYNYWFLQFDFPDENGKPYKSSGGKMVWNEILKRKIPKGWEVRTLGDVSETINGYAFSSDDYVEKGKYKLYTIKNVQDGFITSKVDNYINELPTKMNSECLLSENDIIMSLTGNVGRIGLVYEKNALLNQRVLKLKEKKTSKEFLYQLLRNDFMKMQIQKIASGTSQKNLSPLELEKIKVVLPTSAVLKKFSEITNNFTNFILQNNQENKELKSLRDFLLPLLMNGQVTFKKYKKT